MSDFDPDKTMYPLHLRYYQDVEYEPINKGDIIYWLSNIQLHNKMRILLWSTITVILGYLIREVLFDPILSQRFDDSKSVSGYHREVPTVVEKSALLYMLIFLLYYIEIRSKYNKDSFNIRYSIRKMDVPSSDAVELYKYRLMRYKMKHYPLFILVWVIFSALFWFGILYSQNVGLFAWLSIIVMLAVYMIFSGLVIDRELYEVEVNLRKY